MQPEEDAPHGVRSSKPPPAGPAFDRLLAMGPCPSRRQFLVALGVGAVGVACTRGSSTSPSGSIAALTEGVQQLSVLGTGADAPPMNAGKNRFGFALVDLQTRAIVGGTPQVWLALDEMSRAIGPFAATWHPFTAYRQTGDRSPESPLPGAFAAGVEDRKSTRLNSSHVKISYAVFCLKKK